MKRVDRSSGAWRAAEITAEELRELLAELPHLPKVIDLGLNPLGDAGAEVLAASPAIAGVVVLRLTACRIGPAGLAALARSPHATGLRGLAIDANPLGLEGARALAADGTTVRLTAIEWGADDSTAAEVALALAGSSTEMLTALTVPSSTAAAEGVGAARPADTPIQVLSLQSGYGRNGIGPAGAVAIAKAPRLQGLVTLRMRDAAIGSDGFRAIAGAFAGDVEELALSSYRSGAFPRPHAVGDDAVAAIAADARFARLRVLRIEDDDIGPRGVAALARSTTLRSLELLSLRGNRRIDAASVSALALSPVLEHVTELDLDGTGAGDAGGLALAKSPYLRGLRRLYFAVGVETAREQWTDQGAVIQEYHPGDPSTVELEARFGDNVFFVTQVTNEW